MADFLFKVATGAGVNAVGKCALLAIGLSLFALWRRYRRPNWAETPDKIMIPGGRWVVVALVVFALVLLGTLAGRDPLDRP